MAELSALPRESLVAFKWIALRFVIAYVALTVAFGLWTEAYVTAIAPALSRVFDLAQDDLEVRSLAVENGQGKLAAKILPDGRLGKQLAGRVAKVPFSIAPLAISPVLAFATVVAFPQRSKLAKLLAALFTFPLVLLISGGTLALLITGALVSQNRGGGIGSFGSFLANNGFTQVVSILGALGTSALAHTLVQRLQQRKSAARSEPARVPAAQQQADVRAMANKGKEPKRSRKAKGQRPTRR